MVMVRVVMVMVRFESKFIRTSFIASTVQPPASINLKH